MRKHAAAGEHAAAVNATASLRLSQLRLRKACSFLAAKAVQKDLPPSQGCAGRSHTHAITHSPVLRCRAAGGIQSR